MVPCFVEEGFLAASPAVLNMYGCGTASICVCGRDGCGRAAWGAWYWGIGCK